MRNLLGFNVFIIHSYNLHIASTSLHFVMNFLQLAAKKSCADSWHLYAAESARENVVKSQSYFPKVPLLTNISPFS